MDSNRIIRFVSADPISLYPRLRLVAVWLRAKAHLSALGGWSHPMACRTYLNCSDIPCIYPSHGNHAFAEEQHTVAVGDFQVPLLWIALFRAPDLQCRTLQLSDNEAVLVEAPLAKAWQAIGQLKAALPLYRSLYPEFDSINADAERLVAAIRSCGGRFITLELDELEWPLQSGEIPFRLVLRRQLTFLSSPQQSVAPLRRRPLEWLRRARTQPQLQRELLAAHSWLDGAGNTPDLIGESWLTAWLDAGPSADP